MSIEIEKKLRLTSKQREELPQRLRAIGATFHSEEFEENILYRGPELEVGKNILRLRVVGGRGILTLKERLPTSGPIKHRREEETEIGDPDAMQAILGGLGFKPVLIYEKRRETWVFEGVEVVLDELPFGLFMEIEGEENEITDLEMRLRIEGLEVEHSTYPNLTMKNGTQNGEVVEARFSGR